MWGVSVPEWRHLPRPCCHVHMWVCDWLPGPRLRGQHRRMCQHALSEWGQVHRPCQQVGALTLACMLYAHLLLNTNTNRLMYISEGQYMSLDWSSRWYFVPVLEMSRKSMWSYLHYVSLEKPLKRHVRSSLDIKTLYWELLKEILIITFPGVFKVGSLKQNWSLVQCWVAQFLGVIWVHMVPKDLYLYPEYCFCVSPFSFIAQQNCLKMTNLEHEQTQTCQCATVKKKTL